MSRRTYQRVPEAVRRDDLIAATLDCVASFGIAGATVREIAARAGVTGGLIRHYFDSKDQMLQAAYRQLMTDMCAPSHAIAREEGKAQDCLRRLILANLTPPIADARTISLWAAFIGHIPINPDLASIHREHYLAFLESLDLLIVRCFQELGRPMDAKQSRRLAVAINGLIDGLWLEGSLIDDMFDTGEIAGMALQSIEHMLELAPGALTAEAGS
ncbi:TetR family transcriptional regulator C-terminal domain-containing protein [Allorhizobium pseudoryzae]|uniref:TetR family transcriptional regulator C-terminal domain-containing protein n=1 Tax=Allorhizobium pseudoryzae TaxID=379684 RepID=UPI003D0844ED